MHRAGHGHGAVQSGANHRPLRVGAVKDRHACAARTRAFL